jgi:hypothetical protein
MMKMSEVLSNVAAVGHRLPDPERVAALVDEAQTLIAQQQAERTGARLMSIERSAQTATKNRLLRLLYETMTHISAQGLAAYPGDPVRGVQYGLDHVYGRKASVVGDPGAGGETGVADAAGPEGDEE